ncbi:PLP-dependent aminotransferase family protein [bacterium]|nr:PLP-dependent aminotransferase family protein [bacterium]
MKDKNRYLYKVLATDIEKKILNGTYVIGEKLPSIRELHTNLNLSISTICKAFVELERTGLIEVRPKSGYYIKPIPFLDQKIPSIGAGSHSPQKIESSFISNEVQLAMRNPNYLPLGTAALSIDLMPVKEIIRLIKNVSYRGIKSIFSYSLPQGEPELRRQLALRTVGFLEGVLPDNYIVTNGCTEALVLALKAVVKPEDTVAIESPTFYGILTVLEEMGVYVVEIPTDPVEGVNIEALENSIATNNIKACLFMSNFQNPLGSLIPDEKKEKLVRLLNHHEIPLIEDDVYSSLYHGKERPKPLKFWDRKELVLTCTSFSKTLAPGLRVGWIIAGNRFKNRLIELKRETSIATSCLDQYVMTEILKSGAYDKHLRHLRNSTRKQLYNVAHAIHEYFPKNIRLAVPKGGFLLWVQLPEGVDSIELYYKALEKQISILPGTICALSNQYKEYIRISCGHPFTEDIRKGIAMVGDLIRELSP